MILQRHLVHPWSHIQNFLFFFKKKRKRKETVTTQTKFLPNSLFFFFCLDQIFAGYKYAFTCFITGLTHLFFLQNFQFLPGCGKYNSKEWKVTIFSVFSDCHEVKAMQQALNLQSSSICFLIINQLDFVINCLPVQPFSAIKFHLG